MPCHAAIVDCTHVHHVVLCTNQHMPYLDAAVDCTHVGSAIGSFKDLVRVAQENSTNQTADVLLEDQL